MKITTNELEPFVAFLVDERGVSDKMARIYRNHVRAAINNGQDPLDNDSFELFVATYAKGTRTVKRCAWRHYQTFKEIADVLPDPRTTLLAPDDLTMQMRAFAQWLVDVKGMAANTASSCGSYVKRVIEAVGPTPKQEVLIDYIESQPIWFKARMPSVWRHYREYTGGAVTSPDRKDTFPDDIAYAVWYLAARVRLKLNEIRTLTWNNIHVGDDGSARVDYLPDPAPGRFYRETIPARVVDTLRNWSLPFDGESLVAPASAGGREPMLRSLIHAVATQGATLARDGYELPLPGVVPSMVPGATETARPGPPGPAPTVHAPWADGTRQPTRLEAPPTHHAWNPPAADEIER